MAYHVAPLVGAWIEIRCIPVVRPFYRSLPLWERGLKSRKCKIRETRRMSLPLWERGLKFPDDRHLKMDHMVAPLVGAWIEITI